ncbi:MAG: hypothetical protein ACK5GV_11965 [Bacteroidota bacterium]|jgi:hypothetical protein
MDINLVKDLIKSRRDGLICHLNFKIGQTAADIYPDYYMESLDCKEIQQFFEKCTTASIRIFKDKITNAKLDSVRGILEKNYNLGVKFLDVGDDYHHIEVIFNAK